MPVRHSSATSLRRNSAARGALRALVSLRPCVRRVGGKQPRQASFIAIRQKIERKANMSTTEQERWTRVKGRLRTEVGEDVYSSWFARMDLEGLETGTVRMSVIGVRLLLKIWRIQAVHLVCHDFGGVIRATTCGARNA